MGNTEVASRPGDDSRVESYRRLADIFHDLLSEQSLTSLLERVAETLAELVPYDSLTIYHADEATEILVPALVRDEYEEQILNTFTPFGRGITGWAAKERQPVLSNEAHLDQRVQFVAGTPVEPDALICVPLVSRGHVKGTLNLYRHNDRKFSDEDFELA